MEIIFKLSKEKVFTIFKGIDLNLKDLPKLIVQKMWLQNNDNFVCKKNLYPILLCLRSKLRIYSNLRGGKWVGGRHEAWESGRLI